MPWTRDISLSHRTCYFRSSLMMTIRTNVSLVCSSEMPSWIIEGAKKVIALDYQIPVPDCVTKAIDEYRSQNDWFGHFLDEKCDVDESFKESSSALYQAYRNYSLDCNEYVRSTADFYFALEKAGFERLTLNRKRYFKGLKIHDDNGAEEDFLQ